MIYHDIELFNIIHVKYYNLASYKDNDIKYKNEIKKYGIMPIFFTRRRRY